MSSNHSNWYLDSHNFIKQFFAPTSGDCAYWAQWPDLPVISLSNNYLPLAGDSFWLIPYYVLGVLFIASLIKWLVLDSNGNAFLTSLFSFSEKEVNALDDLLIGILLIFSFFFVNFFGCFSFIFHCSQNLGFSALFLGLGFMLLSIPVVMIYNFGFYFIINIRGGATTLSYLYELVLDYINLMSFMLRLCTQIARIVVIGVTFYMYNHLFFMYNYLVTPSTGFIMQGVFTLTDFILAGIRLVFELGHTFVIFGIQATAFNVMILWLVQFLFTLFTVDTMETSFSKRTL